MDHREHVTKSSGGGGERTRRHQNFEFACNSMQILKQSQNVQLYPNNVIEVSSSSWTLFVNYLT